MSAGSIPVFVDRDYVKPFTEQVDWSEFSFSFSPEEAPDMLRTLRSVSPEELRAMQVIPATDCRQQRPVIARECGWQTSLLSNSYRKYSRARLTQQ